MQGIPPAKDTDAEDVVWGLQTADSLWKRGMRDDALVWLRRAAQAATEAHDEDRALELERLVFVLADEAGVGGEAVPAQPAPATAAPATAAPPAPAPPAPAPAPPAPAPPAPAPDTSAPPAAAPKLAPEADEERSSVLPAETVHAGMYDPWNEGGAPAPPPPRSAAPAASALPRSAAPAASAPPPPRSRSRIDIESDDEVVTSVPSHALARKGDEGARAPAKPPGKPPPLPPRARAASVSALAAAKPAPVPPPTPSDADISTSAPKIPTSAPPAPAEPAAPMPAEPPAPPAPIPAEPPAPAAPMPAEPPAPAAAAAPSASPEPSAAELPALDLESVEAFADLPDDARVAFAAAATLHALAEGEEVSHFALAYVVSGAFDVSATMVDAPALRLETGAVLRARGTTNEGVPMRLIGAVDQGVVATWSAAAVEEAFGTCPWVEDDLRVAADRAMTLVGITIGPLGERLDASIREEIVGRLEMRPLSPGEIVVSAGQPVPGLLLVGVGEIELVEGDVVGGTVGSGEFLFPTEVLGAGAAPTTARAGAGGALVLFGDRTLAQELLVTCPPLLEVFAGM
jgi:hypothetical protein